MIDEVEASLIHVTPRDKPRKMFKDLVPQLFPDALKL